MSSTREEWGDKAKARSKRRKEYFKEYSAKRRLLTPEVVREENRRWYRSNGSDYKNYMQNYRVNNPEKYHAHNEVGKAVLSGRLKRGVCVVCGSDKVHGHHKDYSKPLEVTWLCPKHHAQEHARLKLSRG